MPSLQEKKLILGVLSVLDSTKKIQIRGASFVSDKTHYHLKVICKEFEPNGDFYPWLKKVWTCYEDYEYEHYGYDWINLINADDPEYIYSISNDDFINGRMDKMYRHYKIKQRRKKINDNNEQS